MRKLRKRGRVVAGFGQLSPTLVLHGDIHLCLKPRGPWGAISPCNRAHAPRLLPKKSSGGSQTTASKCLWAEMWWAGVAMLGLAGVGTQAGVWLLAGTRSGCDLLSRRSFSLSFAPCVMTHWQNNTCCSCSFHLITAEDCRSRLHRSEMISRLCLVCKVGEDRGRDRMSRKRLLLSPYTY